MKTLLTIVLLCFVLSVNGQNWKKGLAVAGYHIGTIALGAIGDAQYDIGNKELGHALHAAEVGALISGPFIFKLDRKEALPYISSYVFLRFSFFDSFYNATRDLPLFYQGHTSYYDKVINNIPPAGVKWFKGMSLILGVSIPIKHL